MTAHPIQPSDRIPRAHAEAVLNLWKPQFQSGTFTKSVEWVRKATHAPYATQPTKDQLRATIARVTLVVAALGAIFASVGLALVPLALLTVEWKRQETYCKAMVSWISQNQFVTKLLQEKQGQLTGVRGANRGLTDENEALQNKISRWEKAYKALENEATGYKAAAKTATDALKPTQEENLKLQSQMLGLSLKTNQLQGAITDLEKAKKTPEAEKETLPAKLSAAQAQAKPKKKRNKHNKSPQGQNSASPAPASSPALKQEPEVTLEEASSAAEPQKDPERKESPELKRPD